MLYTHMQVSALEHMAGSIQAAADRMNLCTCNGEQQAAGGGWVFGDELFAGHQRADVVCQPSLPG